jgi:hypothetical protein
MIALLAALLLPLQGEAASTTALPQQTAEPTPIRINLMGGARYGSGDRVRVQVETADDGYLVVLRVDTDGRIRVLFPIDPDLDPFVRGGKTYELRGRADRQTFLADEHNGTGTIYAAVSHDPLKLRDFTTGDHWDYDALRLRDSADDPEAELSRIVARMTDNRHFDYDILDYTVIGPYIGAVGGAYPTTYGTNTGSLGYDPYYNCLSCRWGYRPIGWGISLGFGSRYSGSYYNPWGYDPYDPFYYDPFYYGYNSYPGSYWRYPGQGIPYTVINLPRPHVPTTPYAFRSRPRTPIPVMGGSLGNPSRLGGVGNGSTAGRDGRDGRVGRDGAAQSPGTRSGDRAREPASRSPEPARSPSPPPRVDRQPPSSSGSGSSGAGSSGSAAGTRSRPRGGGESQDAQTMSPAQRATPVSIDRRNDEPRPVFREPPRPQQVGTPAPRENGRQVPRENARPEPPRQEQPRPVYREPPRVERSSPPPAPVVRSSPPPPPPAPAKTSGGSSEPTRSRPRGGGR